MGRGRKGVLFCRNVILVKEISKANHSLMSKVRFSHKLTNVMFFYLVYILDAKILECSDQSIIHPGISSNPTAKLIIIPGFFKKFDDFSFIIYHRKIVDTLHNCFFQMFESIFIHFFLNRFIRTTHNRKGVQRQRFILQLKSSRR